MRPKEDSLNQNTKKMNLDNVSRPLGGCVLILGIASTHGFSKMSVEFGVWVPLTICQLEFGQNGRSLGSTDNMSVEFGFWVGLT